MLIRSLSARVACRGARCAGATLMAAALATFPAPFLAAALSALTAGPAAAQPATLAPVVITGSREPLPLDRLVGDITVIDEKRIRESSADSLESLLSREGGVQLSRTGGPGQTAGVFLRGSSSSSVVVLVDGVRIGSATLGQADLSGLSLASIERIEILRGPGSSLYGSDAVGGVVQIITRRGEGAPNVTAHAAVGQLKSSEAGLSVAGASGGWDYAAGLGREASDGVSALRPGDAFGSYNPDRDGFTRRHASLRGGWTVAPDHRIGASLLDSRLRSQYDGSEFLPPTFTQNAAPDFRNRFDTRVSSLDYRGVFSPLWTSTLQLSDQRDDVVSGATAPDRFKTERRQGTWQNAFTVSPGQQLVGAVERLNEAVESSSFTSRQKRSNTALVLGYTGAFGASGEHRLQADVRHDRNSVYGTVNTGKFGWAMNVLPGLTVRAVGGTAFRGASFNDLYFPGFGVPSVRPERSRSVEFGVQWRDAEQSASATLYRNRVRDLIGYQPDRSFCPPDPVYDFGCAGNVSRASLKGVTLTAAQRFGSFSSFGLRGMMDFLDAKDSNTGQRLVRRAAHQQSVVADWTSGAWGVDATLTAVGARPEGPATLGAYETLDLQARYRVSPAWQLEAKLLNALDRDYQPARDYQSVGRQAWVGVRFNGSGL
jgi:vitamin B12 transporter